MDKAQILDAFKAYDLGHVEKMEPLDFPFRPWKVATDQGEFVVRQCRLNCSPQSLQFEHALTVWLAERGIPASLPVRTSSIWPAPSPSCGPTRQCMRFRRLRLTLYL